MVNNKTTEKETEKMMKKKNKINDENGTCNDGLNMMDDVQSWSVSQVSDWLINNNQSRLAVVMTQHDIDGRILMSLTEDDLRRQPLKLTKLGDIKRLSILIRDLKSKTTKASEQYKKNHLKNNYYDDYYSSFTPNDDDEDDSNEDDEDDASSPTLKQGSSQLINTIRTSNGIANNSNNKNGYHHEQPTKTLPAEPLKALLAMAYFTAVTLLTAFVMVFVHDRVPDMATYPPLPDIFLDNVPLIPWAFKMCELCGVVLFVIWFVILVFHRHRFILVRRFFSLFGSVFLLRCFTMLITSLSVPGKHLECKARPGSDWTTMIGEAYVIWSGGGMSMQGVRTCGDYMFSGHTVVLTLLNFFITEYSRSSLLHTTSWVLNLFGIFFILAGHEHYSIDVFIAFYISTRLFLYYHTLANNRALYQRDRKRTKIWFPLFSFFESSVGDIVPNDYDFQVIIRFLSAFDSIALWMDKRLDDLSSKFDDDESSVDKKNKNARRKEPQLQSTSSSSSSSSRKTKKAL